MHHKIFQRNPESRKSLNHYLNVGDMALKIKKDMAYQRREAVNFQENILLTLSQNIFLAKKENKLRFMNMLEAELPCQC